MPRSTTPRLPWALLALCLIMVTTNLVLLWQMIGEPGIDLIAADGIAIMLIIPSFIPLVAIGALIAIRQPGNSIGWLLCGIGLSWQLFALANAYAVFATGIHNGEIFGSRMSMWLASWIFYPTMCVNVAIVPLLFPHGRPPSGRWRAVFWVAVVGTIGSAYMFAFDTTTIHVQEIGEDALYPNPYGLSHLLAVIVGTIGVLLVIAATVVSGAWIVSRWRHVGGVERQQLKWIAYSGAITATVFLVNTLLFTVDTRIGEKFLIVQVLSFAAFPFAVGIAIVRHRLFDIDLLIRRTLVYGALSICLLATYLALVLALGDTMRRIAGGESGVVVAASTLAVAALFQPLRTRIQRTVDRRFNRSRYDAERTLDQFSARLSEQVDLTSLCVELQEAVTETMQPAHVSLWLRRVDDGAVDARRTG